MKGFKMLCFNKYYSGDEIMEDEMSGAYYMHGRGLKCYRVVVGRHCTIWA
jgi:hypothetical protein